MFSTRLSVEVDMKSIDDLRDMKDKLQVALKARLLKRLDM